MIFFAVHIYAKDCFIAFHYYRFSNVATRFFETTLTWATWVTTITAGGG